MMLAATLAAACGGERAEPPLITESCAPSGGKPVVYQVFTRLFGNKETNNKPWGTIEENGVGKFADFTAPATTSAIGANGSTFR